MEFGGLHMRKIIHYSKDQCDICSKRADITLEKIDQLAYQDLMNINWESSNKIFSVSAYAQFLFESSLYYFYIPETGTFFSVERDGNYYHGYENVVRKCSKEDVLAIATRRLAYARSKSLDENNITHWENICSLINEC